MAKATAMQRPILNQNITRQDFEDFYWLKEELVAFCKEQGIDRNGGKIEIANRISQFLDTGVIVKKEKTNSKKTSSKFNWNDTVLSLETLLTDNYKNSENVRAFFLKNIGSHFHFTVDFMNWTKENAGKSLAEAVSEWHRQHVLKKDKSYKTTIASQFEYNKYMRAFLLDNPEKTSKDAMAFWKLKKAIRGTNEYAKSDLEL